ncbi:hypothetical protein GW813_04140 [bacterium]|nr:hypothetical protein [bacterium]
MYLPTQKLAGRATDAAAITANTTLVADTALSVPVLAGTVVHFRAVIHATSPAIADVKVGLVAPEGSTCVWFLSSAPSAPVAVDGTVSLLTDGAREVFEVTGVLTVGAESGDFGLSFAQLASDAGNTIIHAGSHVVAVNLD